MSSKEKEHVKVRCRYDYNAGSTKELSFAKDEILVVVQRHHSGWWKAVRPASGEKGLLPSNFVEVLDFVGRVRALYDYKGKANLNQLTLKKNDVIDVVSRDESGWWRGELNGKLGIFPRNFVREVEDATTSGDGSKDSSSAPKDAAAGGGDDKPKSKKGDVTLLGEQVICLYAYTAEKPNQLSFKKNDRIDLIDKNVSGWWKGKLGDKIGRFPSNFTKLIENDAPASSNDKGGSDSRRSRRDNDGEPSTRSSHRSKSRERRKSAKAAAAVENQAAHTDDPKTAEPNEAQVQAVGFGSLAEYRETMKKLNEAIQSGALDEEISLAKARADAYLDEEQKRRVLKAVDVLTEYVKA